MYTQEYLEEFDRCLEASVERIRQEGFTVYVTEKAKGDLRLSCHNSYRSCERLFNTSFEDVYAEKKLLGEFSDKDTIIVTTKYHPKHKNGILTFVGVDSKTENWSLNDATNEVCCST